MSGEAAGAPRPGIAGPAILTAALLVLLIGLGKWQLDRKVWKEDLIATVGARLAGAPESLPDVATWPVLTAERDEFRRVRFSAVLAPREEALVFASGSALRPDVSGPGYWVLAPARLAGGGTVVVDRGFAPDTRQDEALRAADANAGPLDLVGVLRWPETPGWFTPNAEPQRNLWFARDTPAIARAKGWGEVAPFYVELESPQPPGGLPRAGPIKVNLPDDHLQYAITWFGLAAVLAGSFAAWLWTRLREPKAEPGMH